MSIINSFDDKSKALIDPGQFFKEPKMIADICIVTFSWHVRDMVLEKYENELVGYSSTANGHTDIYLLKVKDMNLLFYMSPIGAPTAAAVMHEVHYIAGASKFIIYGSSGILDSEKCKGKLIVPTASYRDEGLSYHYMEASDYVDIKNAEKLAEIFDKLKYPYVMGKNWTTDAIYMETVNKAEARRQDGCITVEMEAAGLQAMCNYYGYELYPFFFGADLLEGDSWDMASLGNEVEYDIQKKTFDVAVGIAENL